MNENIKNLNFDDEFIRATREKHALENDLFSRTCKFLVLVISLLMLKSFNVPAWEFPQSLLSAFMLFQAIFAGFSAIMIVSWQYYENRLLKIRQTYGV